MSTTLRVGGRSIEISKPDKLLFPAEGITTGDLIAYYRRIAERLLPYLRGRPLVLRRYPEGIEGEGFFQKEAPEWFPDWIPRVTVAKEDGVVHHLVCEEEATLVFLAAQSCIELHPWLATIDDLAHPDRMVFDLDPSEDSSLEDLRGTARDLRGHLLDLGLTPFLMTSGSRGYHVAIPLVRREAFDEVRALAHDVARLVAAQDPTRRTVELTKAKRGGRVFIDYLRNAYAQTAIAPLSVRARPGAPVAMPIGWDRLTRVAPRSYDLGNAPRHVAGTRNPWAGMADTAASLEDAQRILDRLPA
jgi:bifunctional non-homologous end joining protein LigD